ncbi:MAG: hypothetical protein GY804_03790 [Alphaproteobacteria bacterium]|nr:hypothetical protein [Alphaproteobacteria bacterium]
MKTKKLVFEIVLMNKGKILGSSKTYCVVVGTQKEVLNISHGFLLAFDYDLIAMTIKNLRAGLRDKKMGVVAWENKTHAINIYKRFL